MTTQSRTTSGKSAHAPLIAVVKMKPKEAHHEGGGITQTWCTVPDDAGSTDLIIRNRSGNIATIFSQICIVFYEHLGQHDIRELESNLDIQQNAGEEKGRTAQDMSISQQFLINSVPLATIGLATIQRFCFGGRYTGLGTTISLQQPLLSVADQTGYLLFHYYDGDPC